MTPQESMEARIASANRLLQLGAISWQTYSREVAAARAEVEKTMDSLSGSADLIEYGTQAGYAAMDRWKARGLAVPPVQTPPPSTPPAKPPMVGRRSVTIRPTRACGCSGGGVAAAVASAANLS